MKNFKDEPPKTLNIEEGDPFGIDCAAPGGWPKPNVYWMLEGQNWVKTINNSRLLFFIKCKQTVDIIFQKCKQQVNR